MKNNIINQIHNDEYSTIKYNSVIDYAQFINKIRYNTLNNEDGENSFFNREDVRTITEEEYLTPNEMSMIIDNNKYLRVGACNRQTALKIFGAISEDKEINVFETIERNNLIKKQWEDKFSYCNLLEKLPEPEIKNIFGVKIKSFEKYLIKDAVREKEYVLMIKPINDTSYIVKENIFTNREIMNIHIPEILINIFYFQKPVKLIYVGKNDTEIYIEHNIGIKDGYIVDNGIEYKDFNITSIIDNAIELQNLIKDKKIPEMSYFIDEPLNLQTVSLMLKNKIINNKFANSLLNGENYNSFQCGDCKYRNLCIEIGKDIMEFNH